MISVVMSRRRPSGLEVAHTNLLLGTEVNKYACTLHYTPYTFEKAQRSKLIKLGLSIVDTSKLGIPHARLK